MSILKKTVKILFLFSLVLSIFAYWQISHLPPGGEINEDLFQTPKQTKTNQKPFTTSVGGITYTITPRYEYELWGLVVSEHRTNKWWDYYHENWQDYLNLKDLCVLWGTNLKNGVYQQMEFKSGSWSCQFRWPSQEVGRKFDQSQGSNNHLLSDFEAVNRQIVQVQKGDQIHLKGYLAEYSHDGGFKRGTSVSREDSGNQSCETVYVTAFEIIKTGNQNWKRTLIISKWAAAFFLFSIFLLSIFKKRL